MPSFKLVVVILSVIFIVALAEPLNNARKPLDLENKSNHAKLVEYKDVKAILKQIPREGELMFLP